MRVLVVDDKPTLRESLSKALTLEGYEVAVASDGSQALVAISDTRPDLVILDVLMPTLDGLEVCRSLRLAGDSTPVLMLTVRDRVPDRVAGLDAGADDYLVKPFALEELLARVRALLRRSVTTANGSEVLTFDRVRMEVSARRAFSGERELELTKTEFDLLALFLSHPRQVLTRGVIMDRVWGFDLGPASNTLAVYVGYLRRKLEEGGEPRLIHTVRSFGYVLRGP
ncbi:MAG TPA: response regulator transcription factor [Acidimicrobiia bacterium]|nr:response regulator transcription factor [Acidimicrobiia bacterium]